MAWQFWVDRGGTFTDVVARDPGGLLHVRKLLSDAPERYDDAPLHAIRGLLDLPADAHVPPGALRAVKMGTTLATNALLERKGARVGLLITQGFADLLAIGYQDRPDIFALDIKKPEVLTAAVEEIEERVLADGTIRTALNEAQVRSALERFRAQGVDAIAVVFLHAFAYPEHERQAGALAHAAGFGHVSLSHEVAREIKAVGRGDTTVADAYLTPLLRRYVDTLRDALGADAPLRFMQSSGGLTDADHFSGKNALLSGPAGGVVAYAHVCEQAGLTKAVGFDMGGTSTDVSRYDGRYERVFEARVGGVRIKAPMMAIETVAAGGGSLLQFDGQRFIVGPESAGAIPGPACYGKGGPAAVTDANLVLGRIQPAWFPHCFGPNADAPLDGDASRLKLQAIADELERATGEHRTVEAVAAGFVRIANENMAKPIKTISVARGYDVREYALACFGGAAGQHACALADSLGMRTILIHPLAGVLSAYGMGLADQIHAGVEAVLAPLNGDWQAQLEPRFSRLEAEGLAALRAEGFADNAIAHCRSVDLRYRGTDAFLNIEIDTRSDLRAAFEAQHQALYGFADPNGVIEVVNIRTESIGRTEKFSEQRIEASPHAIDPAKVIARVPVHFDSQTGGVQTIETPVYRRDELIPGVYFDGPAIIIEAVSTIVVDPGWRAHVNEWRHLILKRHAQRRKSRVSTRRDPVLLEVFNNLFMSVADQMGKTLERVSHSANIKERLDFSCAIFDRDGELIANAPHIPVHIGAMAESVKAILSEVGERLAPGDVYLTNDPYHGGSHLPDITAVTPVFGAAGTLAFITASRGHHADIGGITPGSLPPFSKTIEEEGVIIHTFPLVTGGRFHESELRALLTNARYPARNLPERLSDLRAQIAANAAGARLLAELTEQHGAEVVHAYMGHVCTNAAAAMKALIRSLPDGTHTAEDFLDSGGRIACAITVAGDRLHVDFTGTDAQLPGNLNAPPAVVVAAVLYCFRCLLARPIPLNGGCLEPIAITIPEGSLLRPSYPAAVVGGNVETSNRVVDVIYKALGAVAASQGTMNNLTFGTRDWGYYETICGGAGAGDGFHGASAVHTHMTNTRITDPEVLERRYPVVLRAFSIRRGSGGAGKWNGGDGVVRTIEFREPVSVGILSERRTTAPYGLNGGSDGAPGRNTLLRADGARVVLDGHAQVDATAGDSIVIETPGGGGFDAMNSYADGRE